MRIIKLALILLFMTPGLSQAFAIAESGTEGLSIIVTSTDNIIATYLGNSANYSNDLYLIDPDTDESIFVFNNHSSTVGSTVDLGSFEVGTELIFYIYVNQTGYKFYTGNASRNPDGYAHARVQEDWDDGDASTDSVTLVSFEDLYNGAFNYNDLSFSFTNTTAAVVPVPGTLFLLGAGIISIAGIRRKEN